MRQDHAIAGWLLAGLLLLGPVAAGAEPGAPFVLVHGAWVGEWTWQPVAERLRAAGHTVHNVSLKGQGTRRDEHGPEITLADHVADVVAVLDAAPGGAVTLVGHSYGGKVVTGAWDRRRSRVARLVYVDAFAPVRDGPDPFLPPSWLERLRDAAVRLGAWGGMIPFPNPDAPAAARTVPMPLATISGAWSLSEPLPEGVPLAYVLAGNNDGSLFAERYFPEVEADPRWRTLVLETGHNVMAEAPEALTAFLLDFSDDVPGD